MKYNYWFLLLLLLFLSFNVYLVHGISNVAGKLTQVTGTLTNMSIYGAQGPSKVTVELKEYPGIKFSKKDYGEIEKMLDKQIETVGKIDTPYIHMGRLPEADLQVIFYVFKDQKITVGTPVQYFYLRKADKKYSTIKYYSEVLFYCVNSGSFLITAADILSIILFCFAFRYEQIVSTDHYSLTKKTKLLMYLLAYGFIISMI